MDDDELEAHDQKMSDLSPVQLETLMQRMESANWLCNASIITWNQYMQSEAAMLKLILEEQA